MQVETPVFRDTVEKMRHEFGLEIAEILHAERHREIRPRAPREIDAPENQRVVERDGHRAETRDAGLFSERLIDRGAECDRDILDEMVVIHPVVARRERETATGVLGERLEHVVEELHVRGDGVRAPVEIEREVDLRLFGFTRKSRASRGFHCAARFGN